MLKISKWIEILAIKYLRKRGYTVSIQRFSFSGRDRIYSMASYSPEDKK